MITRTIKSYCEGLENFGEVEVRNIHDQQTRLVGEVLVPRDYQGSYNTGAPNENVSMVAVCSFNQGISWQLL